MFAGFFLAGIGIGLGVCVAAAAAGGGAFLVALWILGAIVSRRVRRQATQMCTPACAGPQFAVDHLGWSGTVSSFSFRSSTYAVKFADANGRHLINVSMALRRLLEEHAARPAVHIEARRSAPAPELPAPAQRATNDVTLEWIARIEGYKGPEARRKALTRALEEIEEPQARRELMVAASRIEVAAVLDKVDGLSSAAAKKRHLEKAMSDMRAGDIPPELQADRLRQLEERLRELG
jgi:hypothetical protein